MINLVLTLEQVNGILLVLNNLPTNSNAWPLVQEIVKQVNVQQTPPQGE